MHILRVAQHLYPDTKGGGQYHVHAMSRDQAAMGHDVTVLTTREGNSLPRREETDGYTVIRVPKGITIAGNHISPEVARYLWRVDSTDFDVIHAHSHLYFSTNLAALKRRRGDVPLAITNHGLYSQSASEWLFRWYLKTLGRWTFNQADVVFCYTEADKEKIRGLGVSSRIDVVPNGIDTAQFTPEGDESELIDAEGPVVLFVGRLVDGKRPWIALEVFAKVLKECPEAELYLCGEGPLHAELEEQIDELGMGGSVSLLGHIPYDEMPKLYRSSDVLILPSRAEGAPRTVLEAISSGVRVVTSDLPQLRTIIGSNGRLIDANSSDEMADAIVSAFNTAENGGPVKSVAEMEWAATVERTTESLESLVH